MNKLITMAFVFSLAFVVLMFFSAWQFHNRLSRIEQQVDWMDESFIAEVTDYFDGEGTTERYIEMDEVNRRLEVLEGRP